MTTEHIPKSFWHSVSASVLILTVGFTWITYRSGNLTLRYKDFEVITASATKEIEDAKTALEAKLKESSSEIDSLRLANEAAEKSLLDTKRQLDEIQSKLTSRSATESATQIVALKEQLKAPENALKTAELTKVNNATRINDFKQVQQGIDRLGKLQKEIQMQIKK